MSDADEKPQARGGDMGAPERIWAWAWETDRGHGQWDARDMGGMTYIREDLMAELVEALQKEVERNAAIAIRAMERATLAEEWADHYKARADLMAELVEAATKAERIIRNGQPDKITDAADMLAAAFAKIKEQTK